MSGTQPDYLSQIGVEIAKVAAGSVAGFAIGLLMKKTIWRWLLKGKKWLFNDILSLNLLAVRQYPYVEVKDVELSVFDQIKSRFGEAKLVQKNAAGMILYISPIFGNLVVEIEKGSLHEDNTDTGEKIVRLIVRSENPVRLGIRELRKLKQFETYADGIFDTIQTFLFAEQKPMRQNYAVCDITRTVYFVQDKIFDLQDDEAGVRVHGTNNKLTITVSPISKITEAIEKYHFA